MIFYFTYNKSLNISDFITDFINYKFRWIFYITSYKITSIYYLSDSNTFFECL